jgi:predicted phosphodiesterase
MESTWWPEADKTAFYELVKDKPIKAIVVGHTHTSGVSSWNGIPIINGSGGDAVVLNLDTMETSLISRA